MLFENIKLAMSSMVHNKMRTFLSLLGIVIGVGSVVTVLNLGSSATDSITSSMQMGGIDTINLYPMGSSAKTAIFDESFGDEIIKQFPGIRTVLPILSSNARVRAGKTIKSVMIEGVTSTYFDENMLSPFYGELFTANDNISRRQVVVLGSEIAKTLFPLGDAVGSYISIFRQQSKRYQVVGVLEAHDAILGASYNDSVFIPFNTYNQRFRNTSVVSSYTLKVADGYDPLTTSDSIESYLNNYVGSDYFSIFSPATMVEMANSVTKTFSTFLAAIAAISLIVGGIGIMNIMLVSVAERTREIGVRKALGATPKDIKAQFLTEATTLTLFGGIIGLLLGVGLSYAATRQLGWTMNFSYLAVAISLGFSMFVGIFFGWYPAAKAAKLDPIDALSYE